MRSICFYFQVHQPYRLRTYRFFDIGSKHNYFDDHENEFIMKRVAEKSYLPMNALLLKLIKEYGSAFKVSFSISGMALEQFEAYSPEVIKSFKKLADTGQVEFLAETYAHSLASLRNPDEFRRQAEKHSQKVEQLFGTKPTTFRNTELIYSDKIGELVADMGYKLMLTEGAKHVLGWKSPNFLYNSAPRPELKLLLKNYRLSDDIAFRFSNRSWSGFPLTADKFSTWLNQINEKEEVVNLFMDYETFGEHQWEQTGIFDFMKALPGEILKSGKFAFHTPRELGKLLQPVGPIHVPYPISWADEERDITAWLGNDLQDEAFGKLYNLEKTINNCSNPDLLKTWEYLQTSDHFYYMCTKWFSDGDVHKYFNPYGTPYEAFINYMNVLSDFALEVEKCYSDNQNDVQELKQVAAQFKQKASKVIQGKIDEASKKVKAISDKSKGISLNDMGQMSNAALKKFLKEIDAETLAVALKDAEKELVEKVIPNLSAKAKKQFTDLQSDLQKFNKTEVKKYQQIIENKLKSILK
ncbi:MAG: polysaccharide deacetylase family protein [Bacteroidetes bacterium]|nr:polysaccharide deacetylase family protein [Bacteroidota bacterium]